MVRITTGYEIEIKREALKCSVGCACGVYIPLVE